MKTKLFLMLFALNGLLLGANSASASTSQSAFSLSHTIANLVDLDADAQSLVELAINRALLAKSVKDNDKDLRIGQEVINGRVANPHHGPIINGKIVNPNSEPIINGQVINSNPIINGRVANPRPKPPVLINGIIYNPNQQPQQR